MGGRSAMYSVDEWHDFYVMVGGASAALTGLIFVAISIHLRAVIATPLLRTRARYMTVGLMLAVITSGFVLVPRQSRTALGWELVLAAVVTAIWFAVPVERLVLHGGASMSVGVRVRQVFAVAAHLLWVVSGVSLIVGHGGGLYVLFPAVLLALSVSVGGAWSLLASIESREDAIAGREPTPPGEPLGETA